jgi:hypothetical protein
MKRLRIILLLCYTILLLTAGCQRNGNGPEPIEYDESYDDHWAHMGWVFLGLKGKYVTAVEDTPWGLFAGTLRHGVYRFDEQKKRWTPVGLNHAPISELAYAATQEPMLLAAVRCCPVGYPVIGNSGAIYASKDGGETWQLRDGGLAQQGSVGWAWSLVVDESQPERIFFGMSDYQLLLSEDGGETWDFASGSDGNWLGLTVTIALSADRDGRIWFGGQDPNGISIIYRSDDWGRDAIKIVGSGGWVEQIYADREQGNILWSTFSGSIIFSEDGGDSWAVSLAPEYNTGIEGIDNNEKVSFVGLVQDSERTTYALGILLDQLPDVSYDELHTRLYRSKPEFLSWSRLETPIDATAPRGIKIDNEGRLLIYTTSGLWRFL